MTDELHTPDQWCRIRGLRIYDPDGWRYDQKSWHIPISLDEFCRRSAISTISLFNWGPDAV